MVHASTSSLKILEAHQVGSSVDATVLKLHEIWMPICKQLDCDHSSFWDLNYASYHQTASLLQLKSGHAARRAARNEIRHRVKLERRVVDFVSENYEYYSKIYNGSTHLPPGRRFVDSSFIQASSRAARSRLADMGRQSMLEHVIPFMKQIATQDEPQSFSFLSSFSPSIPRFVQLNQQSNQLNNPINLTHHLNSTTSNKCLASSNKKLLELS